MPFSLCCCLPIPMNTNPDKPPKIFVVDNLPIESLNIHHDIAQEERDTSSQLSSSEPQPTDQKEALPFTISHTALSQALNVSEITYLIRQELRGVDLKKCVMVHSSWWECFAPYLWERIFIDSYPGKSDQGVIFRNGLAARSLTLSIYDEDVLQAMETRDTNQGSHQGLIVYIAERCRNVTTLDLKLYYSHLVIKKETLDDASRSAQDQEENDHQTQVLDALFQKLPHVTDLSLSIVHEDLDQAVVNSVRHLPQLRNLTLIGGLRGNASYMIKKNRRCHWPSLTRILQRSCPLIESLSVAWESPITAPEENAAQEQQQEQRPESSLIRLRTFEMSHCRFLDEHQLDSLFWSSPNLRRFTLDTVSDPNAVLGRQLCTMIEACPRLQSFQLLRPVSADTSGGSDFGFLKSSSIQVLSDLVLSAHSLSKFLWELIIQKDEATDLNSYYCALPVIRTMDPSPLTMCVTSLTLNNISDMSPVWAALQAFTRLERLTLEGQGVWQSRWSYHNNDRATEVEEILGMSTNKLCILEFEASMMPACADTLQYLDMSRLEFHDDEAYRLFMKVVVQRMKRVKHLHLSREQIQQAYLEQTWSYEPPSEKGNPREVSEETAGEILREKVFINFGTIEFLYIHLVDYALQNHSTLLSRHALSALTRAMPKLRALAHDRLINIQEFPLEEFVWMTITRMEPLKLTLA